MAKKQPDIGVADFENRFKELEKIVERMESRDQTLDTSIKDFENGMDLCTSLQQSLRTAEQKIQILMKRSNAEDLEDYSSDEN